MGRQITWRQSKIWSRIGTLIGLLLFRRHRGTKPVQWYTLPVFFATAARAADHVGLDRRGPHDRRNMVLGPAVSSLRRNEIQTVPDPRSANGTSTRAIPKW